MVLSFLRPDYSSPLPQHILSVIYISLSLLIFSNYYFYMINNSKTAKNYTLLGAEEMDRGLPSTSFSNPGSSPTSSQATSASSTLHNIFLEYFLLLLKQKFWNTIALLATCYFHLMLSKRYIHLNIQSHSVWYVVECCPTIIHVK